MNSRELSSLLRSDRTIRLLDVRTASEFENAHINGAYNVPLDQLNEHAAEVRAAQGQVVLICQSGKRARTAEELLKSSGMANVHVLDGGMSAWIGEGQPVRRLRARMSLERQVRIAAGAIVAISSIAALTVEPMLAIVPALVGSGLVFAGICDICMMGMLLAKLPYNRASVSCDTEAIVRQFLTNDGARNR